MAGFNALSIRDLVALVTIASRTMREGIAETPEKLVGDAFAVADEFVKKSEGRWAEGARQNHHAKGAARRRE